MITTEKNSSIIKRALLVTAVTSIILALSACGGKLSTKLNFETPEKGVRIMTLSFDAKAENVKKAFEDVAKIDNSIKNHIPKELTYKGITSTEASHVATFELSFNSLNEYKEKIDKLTDSDEEFPTHIRLVDSPLVKGVVAEETFKSADLFGWLADGLVEDGFLEKSDKNLLIDSDEDIVLNIEGKSYTSKAPLRIDNGVEDNGFYSVYIEYDNIHFDKPTATLWYILDSNKNKEKEKIAKDFLTSVLPKNVDITHVEYVDIPNHVGAYYGQSAYKAVVGADTVKDLNPILSKALGDKGKTLVIGDPQWVKNKGKSNGYIGLPITIDFDCANVCSPKGDGFRFGYAFLSSTSDYSNNIRSTSWEDESKYMVLIEKGPFHATVPASPILENFTTTIHVNGFNTYKEKTVRQYSAQTNPVILELLKSEYAKRYKNNKISISNNQIIMESPELDAGKIASSGTEKEHEFLVNFTKGNSNMFTEEFTVLVRNTIDYNYEENPVNKYLVIEPGNGISFTTEELIGKDSDSITLIKDSLNTFEKPISVTMKSNKIIGWIVLSVVFSLVIIAGILLFIFRNKVRKKLETVRNKKAANRAKKIQDAYKAQENSTIANAASSSSKDNLRTNQYTAPPNLTPQNNGKNIEANNVPNNAATIESNNAGNNTDAKATAPFIQEYADNDLI